MTEGSDDAAAFDRYLEATASPGIVLIARAVRTAVLATTSGAIEWFDPGNGLLALGSRRSMRGLWFAIIPHRSHVNLQLADGVDLPNASGRIEGTGKRIRHVKVKSLEEAASPWLAQVIQAQVDVRTGQP